MKKLIIILFQICLISYISQAQIINIEDKRVRLGDSIAFKGHFDVGFNIVKNDKKLITVAGITQCEYVNHRHVVLGLSGYNWEVIFRQAVYKTDFDFFSKKNQNQFHKLLYQFKLILKHNTQTNSQTINNAF